MELTSRRIKGLREDSDQKQSDVAKALNISQAKLSYLENGHDLPSDMLIAFCKYFNVSADYLLGLSSVPRAADLDAANVYEKLLAADPASFAPGDLSAIAASFAAYYKAGAPAGSAPMICFRSLIAAMDEVLAAAVARDFPRLLNATNDLSACCLRANDILKKYLEGERT
ncbi:MAG: helix-turn-helix transcriptional regulator [Clostridia bacterium]